MGGHSYHRLLLDQLTLALDAPAVAGQISIAAHHAVARDGQCDWIGGASPSHRARRRKGTDPAGQLHVGHRPSGGNGPKFLPDAALERSPTHIEREIEPF